jgi:2',3'-cyclic-nucleotide 2'-phosphodiesterase (5'-nucleotidase family)
MILKSGRPRRGATERSDWLTRLKGPWPGKNHIFCPAATPPAKPSRRIFLKNLLAVFLGLCSLALSAPLAFSQIKIFVTNDVHGQVMTEPDKGRIGYALLKAHMDEAVKSGFQVYLLDAGDAFSGSAYAQADHGRSIAALMGIMGYRALTPGNHAFDYNEIENNPLYYSQILLKTLKDHSSGQVSATAQNLSLNGQEFPGLQRGPVVIHDETDENPHGRRLIVAGLITPYTARPSLKDSLPGYDFGLMENHAATREKLVGELTASLEEYHRPGDVVIVLSHLGYAGPLGDKDGRITGPDLAGAANVDFVADGHTHTAIEPKEIGRTVYGNGGRYLENFLEISLEADGVNHMELKGYADLAGLRPDPKIENWLAELERRQGLSEILFELPKTDMFSDHNLRTENIPLGRLICRAMMQAAGADLAVHNIGGIRAGLPAGPVSARALYDVLPFGDELVTVELNGQKLTEIFDRGSGHGGHGFPQFYGLTVYAWREPDSSLKSAGILDQSGSPLVMDKQYLAAMNGFMAKNLGAATQNYGELVVAVKRKLSQANDLEIEDLTVNQSLFIFPSRHEALKAWEKAGPGR